MGFIIWEDNNNLPAIHNKVSCGYLGGTGLFSALRFSWVFGYLFNQMVRTPAIAGVSPFSIVLAYGGGRQIMNVL